MAYDVFLFKKNIVVGYYELAIFMSTILFLISLGYLYLDIKKVGSNKKSFVFAIVSFIATVWLSLYIRENGLTGSAWFYTSENGVIRDHGLMNQLNILAVGFLLIWVVVELIVLVRVYRLLKDKNKVLLRS